jgi:outer membrane protein
MHMFCNSKKVLLALLICSLPSLGTAAESTPATEALKTPAPVQAAPPTDATAAQKTPETAKAAQSLRLGYVDIARISSESALGKASTAQAKVKQEKLQTQIQAKRKQLDKQKSAIEAKFASLTPAQREAKGKEFQKKVEEFQKFGLNAEKELQTLQEELSKALFDMIEQTAVEYGKANGLALVVIKRELLYLSSTVDAQDVSNGIIKLMDEKWQKK